MNTGIRNPLLGSVNTSGKSPPNSTNLPKKAASLLSWFAIKPEPKTRTLTVTPLHAQPTITHNEFLNILQQSSLSPTDEDKLKAYITCNPTQIDQGNTNNLTPLMLAALCGNTQMAELQISEGAEIDKAMDNGNTALTIAVIRENTEMVKLLILKGAKNLPNSQQETPSHLAIMCKNHEIAGLFAPESSLSV